MQHYRFGDSFIIYYEVDDDVMDAEVFRLMLQPVVENSLLHALRGNERGYMKVRARRIGDKVNLRVIDNGDGMTREELETLRKRIADRNSRSIGLTNLDRRLRLRYPEETGLRICSIKTLAPACRFASRTKNIPRMPRKRVKQNNKMPGRYLKLRQNARDDTFPAFCVK